MKNLVYVLIVLVFSSCSDSFTQSASVGLDNNNSVIYIGIDKNDTKIDISTQNNDDSKNTEKSIYNELDAKTSYATQCKVCHGIKGEGSELAGKFFRDKTSLKSRALLKEYIVKKMPYDNPSKCDDKCADNILTYALKNFTNNDINNTSKDTTDDSNSVDNTNNTTDNSVDNSDSTDNTNTTSDNSNSTDNTNTTTDNSNSTDNTNTTTDNSNSTDNTDSTSDNSNQNTQSSEYIKATYFVEWSVYGRDFHVKDIPASKLTHLLYGFLAICGENKSVSGAAVTALEAQCKDKQDYEVTILDKYASLEKSYPDTSDNDPYQGNFSQLKKLKEQYPNLKILPSIGGWTMSDPFFKLAASPSTRKVFVDSAIAFIKKYDFFDGLDIDWEFPGGQGANPSLGSSADKANYSALMSDLRDALDTLSEETGREYQLTTAIGTSPSMIDAVDYSIASQDLNYIFMMTYDYYGAWSSTIGHQSGLYPTLNEPIEGYNIDASVKAMLAQGVDSKKLAVGVSKYGRGWSGVENISGELKGSAAISGTWEAGILDYKDIVDKYFDSKNVQGKNGFVYKYDEIAQAATLFNETKKEFISFDDVRAVKAKANYVKQNNLAGLFSWEIDADNGELMDAMYNTLEQSNAGTDTTSGTNTDNTTTVTDANTSLSGISEYKYWVVGAGAGASVIKPSTGIDATYLLNSKKVATLKAKVPADSYAEMSLPINPYESDDPFFTPKVDLSASKYVSITYSSNTDAILQLRQTDVHGGNHNQATLASSGGEIKTIRLDLDSDFLWLGTSATTLDKSNVGKFNFAFLKQNQNDGFAQITIHSFSIDNYSPIK